MNLIERIKHRAGHSFFLIGLLSLAWFLFRSGCKPSRISYPCQQASAASSCIWLSAYVLPLVAAVPRPSLHEPRGKVLLLAAFSLLSILSLWAVSINLIDLTPSASSGKENTVQPSFAEHRSYGEESSDIFVVNNTTGKDSGIRELISLMKENGLSFYDQENSPGIISRDDVVIIKVNCQWDQRGGTNTDLVKSLVHSIVDHPQGFSGEIVIADNGQGQYGSTGHGGSLSYARNNALDISQSMQKVAESFEGYKVSIYLWDAITTNRVMEYSEGDLEDGYVVSDAPSKETGIVVTYPKFRTQYGTYVSFKKGIWQPEMGTYDSEKLKVINIPVLKSHGGYGVTASVKHYMGVVSDKLSRQAGGRAHYAVAAGGMGTEMVETRFPALNILDAIWVNANPRGGPGTSYDDATKIEAIAASTDPVALDFWAAKNILMPAARAKGYRDLSSLDPNNASPDSFGDWLRLSMREIQRAGYQATMDEGRINVHLFPRGPI